MVTEGGGERLVVGLGWVDLLVLELMELAQFRPVLDPPPPVLCVRVGELF